MKSRVFVSCGQHDAGEREVAKKVGELLVARGFDPYIAIDVQTILEINTGIIRELKNSDCYLLINFRREKIDEKEKYRGSLFSNQELAIAHSLNFERILVINQSEVLQEGMLRYIGNNTEIFEDSNDCCATVERALDRAGWTNNYSRRLVADQLRFSDNQIRYGNLIGQFLYLDIRNHRPDIAALEATARLSEFGPTGQDMQPSKIRSPLKATGRPGYRHTIFPRSHEAFDLLCVGTYNRSDELIFLAPPASGALVGSQTSNMLVAPHSSASPATDANAGPTATRETPSVFLNTALDEVIEPRLPIAPGVWNLRYEFFAVDFPLLSVLVELTLTADDNPRAIVLNQEQI